MALSQRLEFRQSQALVMTPQLMQAIKLLQLSNLDLAAYVEGELERNPLLERSVRHRFPYLDPLNHVQVELLKEHRTHSPDEQVLRGIQLTINGISAGLRNSG